MEGGSGGNDRELLSKTLQFEHKLFYFDLKQNPRGQYLKISEKTAATRSTIIVPALEGIQWFIELFHYYVSTDEREICSKELKLDTKVYYFDMGENKRGRFLKELTLLATSLHPTFRPRTDMELIGNRLTDLEQIGNHTPFIATAGIQR